MSGTPRIAVTSGDPCGIGPEVILKSLSGLSSRRASLLIIGDLPVFERTAKQLGCRLPKWTVIRPHDSWPSSFPRLSFLDCGHQRSFRPGHSNEDAGRASIAYLDYALTLWQTRHIDALVTAPVTKWAVEHSVPGFVGHTEYLAQAMGQQDVAMMFVSDQLRIVLLTRHLPLAQVAGAVDRALIQMTLKLTYQTLTQSFHLTRPRLAVCGLNPHAGENGILGREEQRVLQPALRHARHAGMRCDGPFAADGFFAHAYRDYDATICWYHDQGLIPFKMAARDRGCQLTLGLPLIRTAPDHGSALDIAGRGIAHPGSMRYALALATRLAC